MTPVIKSLLDVIRIAEKSSDENRYFSLFKDVVRKVTDASELMYAETGELNLFQEAANSGFSKYVKYLLDTYPGIDPNSVGRETPPAVFMAINNSHHQVLQTLIDHRLVNLGNRDIKTVAFDAIDTYAGRCIFHSLPFHRNDSKSIKTAETLMSTSNLEIKLELLNVINIRDCEGYTALDYAIISSTQEYMKMLVGFGASMAHHGQDDVITKIPPHIIEHVLNTNCLKVVPLDKSMKDSKIYQQLEDGVGISANFEFLRPTDKQMGTEAGNKYLERIKKK